jgi:nicotinate-nucleotide pyrophosphorylase (carboxylating)
MMHISRHILSLVDAALTEDAAFNDVTTDILMPRGVRAEAVALAKAPGVLAGAGIAEAVFLRVDPALETRVVLQDGARLQKGSRILNVSGNAASILKSERTALNFLQRMSGIATETSRYVEIVKGLRARIVDTRKTVPGLRVLDKYAVRTGGGQNHRQNLADGVLIKDNHIAALRASGLSLKEIVKCALEKAPHTLKVEVETTTLDEVGEAVEAGAHIIMLDNMPIEVMRQAVQLVKGRALLEASGGVTLGNVRAVAETGVDLISIGALTHSPKALDISLDVTI